MDTLALDIALRSTLADMQLSRSERRAFSEVLAELGLDNAGRQLVRERAFEAARASIDDPRLRPLVEWLEDVVKVIEGTVAGGTGGAPAGSPPAAPVSAGHAGAPEAYFSPGRGCHDRIVALLRGAKKSADICVFTISDDSISREVFAAHRRGVKLRVLSDNEKADDLGSDIYAFDEAGIATAIDDSPAHMHHKFAIVDGVTLLTGSYNWTRGAAEQNAENIVIVPDAGLIRAFQAEFDRLWTRFYKPSRSLKAQAP